MRISILPWNHGKPDGIGPPFYVGKGIFQLG